MKDKRLEEQLQHALNAELSGLRTTSYQRDQFFENATGGYKVKRKLSAVAILVAALMLITVTALAVALLSPKEVVEQVAVPIAQENEYENYSYDELLELITTLNENGITLDEGSRIMQAFQAGHGYWERDTIEEICRAAFGEKPWTVEQFHWYGEMMVAIGVWTHNDFLLPEDGDLTEREARELAVKALKDAYDVELPVETNGEWLVSAGFVKNTEYDENGDAYKLVQWDVTYSHADKPNTLTYDVTFDRHGDNVQTDHVEERELDERSIEMYNQLQAIFSKEQEAISKYGEVMHFWPDEVKVEIYGGAFGLPFAIPDQADYDMALNDAKKCIAEKYGEDALKNLGDYKVGYLFQKLDDEDDTETKMTQLMWDMIFTTDPDFLSDGYRVQFQRILHHETGKEEIIDIIVEHANLGSG